MVVVPAREQRDDDESGNDGRNNALLGRHTTGNTKGNGQWQGYDADNDTCHEVGSERLLVVMLNGRQEFRLEI